MPGTLLNIMLSLALIKTSSQVHPNEFNITWIDLGMIPSISVAMARFLTNHHGRCNKSYQVDSTSVDSTSNYLFSHCNQYDSTKIKSIDFPTINSNSYETRHGLRKRRKLLERRRHNEAQLGVYFHAHGRRSLIIGHETTPHQDIIFSPNELTEMTPSSEGQLGLPTS
ncbi:hypothetical protein TIFTF001_040745 [Ficus carica]|uniref:Uncharacterized protein n=1 Tax=Ficus carica TaxID=3494 RepID=A0AA88CL49_FICCA|nr:hypothetical protein TIFTF001_040724 [Ficus carica]GMN25563.1 hypothetical protein TIFTF001_040734 [Ficus carica]GMN25594.1 hypothetical protein TIFTF001_040741 [Ficus carica]GMN25610.1 hypothetical protein TIFTF001_040745 [Ficus carica]